jgi:hypothetical protein
MPSCSVFVRGSNLLCVEVERFAIDRRQLSALTRYAGALTGGGIVLVLVAVAAGAHRSWEKNLLGWGIGVLAGGVVCLWSRMAYARAYTEITADGIATRGLAGSRRARWADVTDIRVADYQRKGVFSVRVLVRGAEAFRLGAPVSSRIMDDPEFDEKVQRILAAWSRAAPR